MLKGYCVGRHVHVVERPSLPDLRNAEAASGLVRFDSQQPLPAGSAFGLDDARGRPAAAALSDDVTSGAQEAAAAGTGGAWGLRRACVERITLDLAHRLGVQLLGDRDPDPNPSPTLNPSPSPSPHPKSLTLTLSNPDQACSSSAWTWCSRRSPQAPKPRGRAQARPSRTWSTSTTSPTARTPSPGSRARWRAWPSSALGRHEGTLLAGVFRLSSLTGIQASGFIVTSACYTPRVSKYKSLPLSRQIQVQR